MWVFFLQDNNPVRGLNHIFCTEINTDTKTIASIVKTVQRFINMLHLSQMVLFLSGNGGPWNCARYRLSTKGQYLQNMLMNFQNHSIPSFCSTHLLGGSRQRDILPNEIVQKMLQIL